MLEEGAGWNGGAAGNAGRPVLADCWVGATRADGAATGKKRGGDGAIGWVCGNSRGCVGGVRSGEVGVGVCGRMGGFGW